MWTTHEVTNQVPDFPAGNAWLRDEILRSHALTFGAKDAAFLRCADSLGDYVGSIDAQRIAERANRNTPVLRTHDRWGRVLDTVDYDPAYHALMRAACRHGLKDWSWTETRAEAPIERAVLFHLWNGLEQGAACPITMSNAALALLDAHDTVDADLARRICARDYDPEDVPLLLKKSSTIGMALTEKQGGSDLRAISTRAELAEPQGPLPWRLTGHKWFCSAPMSDGFFALARGDDGVSCFFVPRRIDEAPTNGIRVVRLKDKCGNRSNASSEIEFVGARARLVGGAGRGIATLIGMAHLTRFDIVCAVPGMMRAGLVQVLHHARHREAFGRRLITQPLMRNVLADLAIEWEASLLLALHLAHAFAEGGTFGRFRGDAAAVGNEEARAVARVLTPIAKYWLCKRLPAFVAECMECFGGNGYVEDWPVARLYREAPLNGIWEGSANVICLDVLRSVRREPDGLAVLQRWIADVGDARVARSFGEVSAAIADVDESQARRLIERAAVAIQAALMRKHAPTAVADAFVDGRIDTAYLTFGTLPSAVRFDDIIERAGA